VAFDKKVKRFKIYVRTKIKKQRQVHKTYSLIFASVLIEAPD